MISVEWLLICGLIDVRSDEAAGVSNNEMSPAVGETKHHGIY